MTTFFRICMCFLMVTSCHCPSGKKRVIDQNTYSGPEDTLYLPFDTARVLRMYDFKTQMNLVQELGSEAINGLESDWDTLELELQQLGCDCPNWYDYARIPDSAMPSMSPPYGYYLEAASSQLNLPGELLHAKVRFIGKHYKQKGWPSHAHFTNPEPPEGNVFRFYAYEWIFPTVIYGPLYHTGTREIPSDPEELILATKLKMFAHQ